MNPNALSFSIAQTVQPKPVKQANTWDRAMQGVGRFVHGMSNEGMMGGLRRGIGGSTLANVERGINPAVVAAGGEYMLPYGAIGRSAVKRVGAGIGAGYALHAHGNQMGRNQMAEGVNQNVDQFNQMPYFSKLMAAAMNRQHLPHAPVSSTFNPQWLLPWS